MLWRLTCASYTLSTDQERQYLLKLKDLPVIFPANKQSNVVASAATTTLDTTSPSRKMAKACLVRDYDETGDSQTIRTDLSQSIAPAATAASTSEPDCLSAVVPSASSAQLVRRNTSLTATLPVASTAKKITDQSHQCVRFQYRTITGTSCMVLRHLFDPLNTIEDNNNSNNLIMDSARLPACLLVINPSPDTLGRFLNAAAHAAGYRECNNHHGTPTTSATVGWDLLASSSSSLKQQKTVIFYISSTTCEIKYALEYLSDYNSSAIIDKGTNYNNETKEKTNDAKSNTNKNKKGKQKKTMVVVDYLLQQYMQSSSGITTNK
jgi:hypothetical protein